MSSIPLRLQQILDGLEGEHFEFKQWKTKDDFDGLTKYACSLANDGKAIPPRRGRGGLWKSTTCEAFMPPDELDTNPGRV